jgi:hypothetical protein
VTGEPIDLDELASRDDDAAGDKPARPKRRRTERDRERDRNRRRTGARRPPQEARLREAIEAAGGLLRDRGDDELGSVLERDAGKMARVLGSLAIANPAAAKAVAVLADVLEPVRAFGPSLRILWRRLLERRAAAQEAAPEEPEEWLHGVEPIAEQPTTPAGPEPEPQVAEPWRLSAGG